MGRQMTLKILIYGGCHASAFARILNQYGRSNVTATTLTNFRLIAKGTPFPYDDLSNYDLVIFSPIFNKEEYNTDRLEEVLQSKGVNFVKYPWIQWNGYFPGFRHKPILDTRIWWNDQLSGEAANHRDFEKFEEAVLDGDFLSSLAVDNLQQTTTMLEKNEEKGRVHVPISGWIQDNFRDRRLLLTPDHAATDLYKFMMSRFEELIGPLVERSFYYSTEEVQDGLLTPILPSVARALDLKFKSADFRDPRVASSRVLSLREYLRIAYESGGVYELTVSANQTRVKFADTSPVVQKGFKLIATPGTGEMKAHVCYTLISGGDELGRSRDVFGKEFFVFRGHWDVKRLM